MAETEMREEAKTLGTVVSIKELEDFLRAGKRVTLSEPVPDPRNTTHRLLDKGHELSSLVLSGLANRGITKAEVLHNNGIVSVKFLRPKAYCSERDLYQGAEITTAIKEPVKWLISYAKDVKWIIPVAKEIVNPDKKKIANPEKPDKDTLDNLIDSGMVFLNQEGLTYKKNEKPFFEAYRAGDYTLYREAIGTALLAVARGYRIPKSKSGDDAAFVTSKEQIAIGTFMTPLALQMAPEHKKRNPFKCTGRNVAEVASDLLRENGFSDAACLIVRCSGREFPSAELADKHVRIRLPCEARNDYKALYGGK